MNDRLAALAGAGVSIWLDDLSRSRLISGNLAELVATKSVTGVTTNPTIFAAALAQSGAYADAVADLAPVGVDDAIKLLTAADVRDACDVLAGVHTATGGVDGRVSIEVAPTLAHDTRGTIAQARELHRLVDRDGVLIKIPATPEGLPAIAETLAAGISVNVTLIFSVDRYREVMDAYLTGLEMADAAGIDLGGIHSVASFFISRVDVEVDQRLDAAGAAELKGRAGIANAQTALGAYDEVFGGERFAALAAKGAHPQRPLWASTGVKNPAYPDTLYVSELVAPGVVNTMPEKTLVAYANHGEIGTPMPGTAADGVRVLESIAAAGVDLADVFAVLEREGVDKFAASWTELTETVAAALGGRGAG